MTSTRQDSNTIRTMVRGTYDLQGLRVKMGNRVTGNFKAKLGLKQDGMPESELDAEDKKMLDKLRLDYKRITDPIAELLKNKAKMKEFGRGKKAMAAAEAAIAAEQAAVANQPVIAVAAEDVNAGVLPKPEEFVPGEIISSHTELVLVHNYLQLLEQEEQQFKALEAAMTGIPVYDTFLSQIAGVGPAMAGVILSEIDIYQAEYPSSLWKYAGLDVVTVGRWTDAGGKEHVVPAHKIDVELGEHKQLVTASSRPTDAFPARMMKDEQFPITLENVGRSRKEFCLVPKEYINKEGNEAVRNSITFNPWLKTKLIGVLGSSFLRAGQTLVDGKKLGAAKRLKMAEDLGFTPLKKSKGVEVDKADDQVTEFLRSQGKSVKFERTPYGEYYYQYKNRISNSPDHADKTDGHVNNMAMRYMIKRFLVDLYVAWRKAENLPVAEEYSIGKLGMVHKKAA